MPHRPPPDFGLSLFDLDFLSLPNRRVLNYRWGEKVSLVFWVLPPSTAFALFAWKKGWLMWGQGSQDVEAKGMGLRDRARQENGHAGNRVREAHKQWPPVSLDIIELTSPPSFIDLVTFQPFSV